MRLMNLLGLAVAGLVATMGVSLLAAESTSGGVEGNTPTSAVTDNDIIAFIDEQIREGWKAANLSASPKASEGEWCRRVYLDLVGRLPTVDELNKFLAGGGNKKADLLDRLMNSDEYIEEYARNWTTVWSNLLVGRPPARRDNRDPVDREGMRQYLRRSFLENKPYDKMVYELVSATGSTKPGERDYNGAVNFLVNKLQENATEATSKTARLFLGVQVQCTQCHNHPFNDWKQDQFWGMNAFFRQTRSSSTRLGRDIDNTQLINADFNGEGNNPRDAEIYYELRNGTLAAAWPTFIDGTRINASGYVNEVDRRAELGRLMIKSDLLGKAIVNRMWGHFFGFGFTKPVDDMGPHNPVSHPELLDRLGKEFSARGHDLKRLIKWITLSEAYSLSSRITPRNKKDEPSLGETPRFSHFYVRQMEAEQLYESLMVITNALAGRGTYEERERIKSDWLQQFTITFGNDEGDEATTFNGTIPQVLMMMNGALVNTALDPRPGGFMHSLANGPGGINEKVEHLYLAALARKPSSAELTMAKGLLGARRSDLTAALQDVWWSLLNCNEFIFNH